MADLATIIDTIRWVLNDAHYKAPEQIAGCWRSLWEPMLREAVDAKPVGGPAPDPVREAAERCNVCEGWGGYLIEVRDKDPEAVHCEKCDGTGRLLAALAAPRREGE
jgi:hypothetical protein